MSLLNILLRGVPRLVHRSYNVACPAEWMGSRYYSTPPDRWLRVHMEEETGIATLTLQREPANTLSLEFMTDIAIALEKLDNDRRCRGLILTSSVGGIFSGGLQLNEIYQPKVERVREMWRLLQEIWIRIYGSRFVTVAAINGHALAGGCLISLGCDYRVMAEGAGTIGMSGARLGIVPPSWLQTVIVDTIGQRESEYCIGTGHMYSPAEALKVGLIDEVVPLTKLQATAKAQIKTYLKIPEVARQLTKDNMRRPVLNNLLSSRERDTDQNLAYILTDQVQALVGAHIEVLKTKK